MEANISDAELTVMRVVWSLGSAKYGEVRNQLLATHDWSLSTIKTFLGRLVKKKILKAEREGHSFIYTAAVSESEIIDLLEKELLSKVCATKQGQLLADLISDVNLTNADVAALTEKLQEKKTIDCVTCTCLTDFGACNCQHEHHAIETVKKF